MDLICDMKCHGFIIGWHRYQKYFKSRRTSNTLRVSAAYRLPAERHNAMSPILQKANRLSVSALMLMGIIDNMFD